jgi:hypothetical protein
MRRFCRRRRHRVYQRYPQQHEPVSEELHHEKLYVRHVKHTHLRYCEFDLCRHVLFGAARCYAGQGSCGGECSTERCYVVGWSWERNALWGFRAVRVTVRCRVEIYMRDGSGCCSRNLRCEEGFLGIQAGFLCFISGSLSTRLYQVTKWFDEVRSHLPSYLGNQKPVFPRLQT